MYLGLLAEPAVSLNYLGGGRQYKAARFFSTACPMPTGHHFSASAMEYGMITENMAVECNSVCLCVA